MPDPHRKSISATEAPALWNASPYITRWMLWQRMARGVDISQESDALMREGTLLQPYLLERCAEELGWIVAPEQKYVRRGLVGCTRDATVICPDRGPGALETKCVFTAKSFMTKWGGGKIVPREYEIQLQAQMHVGDGEKPFSWGVVCSYFAGQRTFHERAYMPDFGGQLEAAAKEFFDDVANEREPDPFGVPVEIPWLNELFPVIEGSYVDLRESAEGEELKECARRLERSRAAAREQDAHRAVLLGAAKDASKMLLPDGVIVNISAKQKRISVYDPNGDDE